jgi:hypothetical protein
MREIRQNVRNNSFQMLDKKQPKSMILREGNKHKELFKCSRSLLRRISGGVRRWWVQTHSQWL